MERSVPILVFLSVVLLPQSMYAYQPAITLSARNAELLRGRLTEFVALQYCRSRLDGFAGSTPSLNWAKAQARTRYPSLFRQVGSFDDKAIMAVARKNCSYVFDQVIRLPDGKPPKPVTVKFYSPQDTCRLDAFWVDQLRRSGNLYLQGKGFPSKSDGCLVEFKDSYLP